MHRSYRSPSARTVPRLLARCARRPGARSDPEDLLLLRGELLLGEAPLLLQLRALLQLGGGVVHPAGRARCALLGGSGLLLHVLSVLVGVPVRLTPRDAAGDGGR